MGSGCSKSAEKPRTPTCIGKLDQYRARYYVACDRPPQVLADGKTVIVWADFGTITTRDSLLHLMPVYRNINGSTLSSGWDTFVFSMQPDPHGMPLMGRWCCSGDGHGDQYLLKHIFCCKWKPGFLETTDHFQDLFCVDDERIKLLHTGFSCSNWHSSEGRIAGLSAADLAAVFQEKPAHTAQCEGQERIGFFFDLARCAHKPTGFQGSNSSVHNDSRPAGLNE